VIVPVVIRIVAAIAMTAMTVKEMHADTQQQNDQKKRISG